MSDVRSEFLDALQQHDRAAERFSDNKGRGATTQTLKSITDRVNAARTAYAAEIGLSAVHVQSVLLAWRRAGFTQQRALTALEAGWKEREQ